jgi:hypothetical protein
VKNDQWPFDQPPNWAVITLKTVMSREVPILFVSRDEDDQSWQFLTGEIVRKHDAAVIALHEIVELDPSVLELANLPPGWIATRRSANAAWEKEAR